MEIAFFQILVLIISAIVHEVAHGYAALYLGDPTAKNLGRLTLDPRPHIDIFGSILVPLFLVVTNSQFIFAWAKPVPYNPRNLRDPKYGELKVAIAGPLTNVLIAFVFAIILRFFVNFMSPQFVLVLGLIVFINVLLAVFNMIPLPPLDGSKVLAAFLPYKYTMAMHRIGLGGLFLIIFLFFMFSRVLYLIILFFFNVLVGGNVANIFWAAYFSF